MAGSHGEEATARRDMRLIDEPSVVFSSDSEWVQFWLEMRGKVDPESQQRLARAEIELRRRGFDPMVLGS